MDTTQVMQNERTRTELAARMQRMADVMRQAGDEGNAMKLAQVIEKAEQDEMCIAFCGHFSAGKSTMLNTLLGRELLPANPIPTSANVVKIRGGEPAACVYTRQSGVLTFDPDTEMELLKKYAVDGDTVEWVEICYPGLFLDEKASLLDTPGIDSTDAAHKIATESALHLADVVIYMMDYNHVQAEENFTFTKTLKDRSKPVYLVINMIDKHVDFELDFESYKESVEEAFETWGIHPDGIFYTSLAEPDHEYNQYEEFHAKLIALLGERDVLLSESVSRSAQAFIDEHLRFLVSQESSERYALEESLVAEVEGMDTSTLECATEALQTLEAERAAQMKQADGAEQEMEQELTSLLDNARLTYFSTNEAAEKYLESRKQGFKVGFLFTGKKTEEERQARLEALLTDFSEKIASNLDWHFRDLMTKLPERYGIRDEAYHTQVHALQIEVTSTFLASLVKEGVASREYVLNYGNDLSNGIKVEYRRAGLGFIGQVVGRLRVQAEAERAALDTKIAQVRKIVTTYEALERLATSKRSVAASLSAILAKGE